MRKRTIIKVVKWAVAILLIAAVAYGVFLYVQQQAHMQALSDVPNYTFSEVAEGDVLVGVTAKGSVSTQNTTNVVLDWSGRVKSVPFEVGDIVQEGELLAIVEDEDLDDNIAAANSSLRQQEINLQKQIDSLTKTIDAPDGGRIKEIKAKVGEDASVANQTFGQLCWLSPDGKMELTCELDYETSVGYLFDVEDVNYNRYVAEVTAVSGMTATMDIEGDEHLEIGDKVWVYYRGKTEDYIGEGEVSIKNGIKVTGSGKITGILVQDNQMVSRGDPIFQLDTAAEMLSYESQTISVQDAQRKLSDLRKDIGKSELSAPTSGVITELALLEGQSANSGLKAAVIQDHAHLQTVVNIDELDISKVKVGQRATITLEALEGEVYTGKVSDIAVVGVSNNNFATYPVTITFDDSSGIKIGMSCEATIEIESAKAVPVVPVEMLQRGPDGYSVLLVTGGREAPMETPMATPAQGGQPDQMQQMQSAIIGNIRAAEMNAGVTTESRLVEVGLINEDYAQILSGLELGDTVAALNKSTSIFSMMMGGGAAVTTVEGGAGGPEGRGGMPGGAGR